MDSGLGWALGPSCLLPKKGVVFLVCCFMVTFCNCPHELFFPVMSDDSSPVRGPRSPRAESPRHRPPAQPAHLATLAQTKTFRSLAASRHAAVPATSRHAEWSVREPSQARSRIPVTMKKLVVAQPAAWTRTPSTGAPPSPCWTSRTCRLA